MEIKTTVLDKNIAKTQWD